MIKVGILGNLANVGFDLMILLNDSPKINAYLIEKESTKSDFLIKNPFFLEQDNKNVIFTKTPFKFSGSLFRYLEARKYDVLISICSNGKEFLPFSKIKYISYATGSDLRELAVGKIDSRISSKLAKMTFQKCNLLLYSCDHGQIKAINECNINSPQIPWRQTVDIDYWSKPKTGKYSKEISKFDGLKIFHPSNLIWKETFPGQSLKQNDLYFRGFKEFLDYGGIGHTFYLQRGQNIKETEELIRTLNIEKNCTPISTSLNREELREIMHATDIISDQFSDLEYFGLLALEAMSCAKPVLVRVSNELIKKAYPEMELTESPFLKCSDVSDICNALQVLSEKNSLNNYSQKSFDWVSKYHSKKALLEWYSQHINNVLGLHGL